LIVALLLLLWLYSNFSPSPGRFRGNNPSMNFTFWVMAASVLITPVLDFLSISAALNSISAEISTGRWDLLRMTLLRPTQIVAAKHGAAQVRVWRPTMLLVGVRLAACLMLAFTLLRPFLFGFGFRGGFGRGFGSPLAGDPLLAVIAL